MSSKKLPPNVRAHGSGYRAVVGIDGQRYRSPVLPSVADVQAWLKQFASARQQGATTPLELTLKQGLALILDDLRDTGARPATVAFYENHARPLFAGLGGDQVKLHNVTPADVRGYIAARREQGVSAGTVVGKELFVLRRMVKLARAQGYPLPVDAFEGVRTPKSRSVRYDYLTQAQVADVVAKIRATGLKRAPWFADIVELLFSTGIRRAELVRMKVADVQFDKGRIWIDGKARDRHQTFGKALVPVLRRLVAEAQPDGRIVASEDTVEKAFDRWRKKLGLAHFSPHVMRHSYATAMAARVSQWQLMGLMDHSDLKQTARYYHARGDDVRDALDNLRLDPPAPGQSQSE